MVLCSTVSFAATAEETALREKSAAASQVALKKSMVSKEVSAPETVVMAESTVAVPAVGNDKKELTDFQKRMAAIAQGKTVESLEKKSSDKKETPKPEEPKPIEKKVQGTVTGLNNQGIAIEYAQDPDKGGFELWISFSKEIKMGGGIKSLGELQEGDRVSAVYDEYPNMSKKLTGIKLVSKKPPEKETPAEEAEEEA